MNAHTPDKPFLAEARHQPKVEVLPACPSAFTAEEWADYDAGRPERCSPDLMAREARRAWRDRDGW